jgi:competence protein ComEA
MDKRWYWLGAFIVVGILLGMGILILVTRPPRGNPITLLPAPTAAPITVYVSGKVNEEGLYTLPIGSRVNDAIQAAGGFLNEANSSVLNLAKILEDGEQINVPGLITPAAPGNSTRSMTPVAGMVDINTASLEQLDTLPDIGPITAQDIIDYRNTNGPFASIESIMDVPGIGQGKFEAIKDLIIVGTSCRRSAPRILRCSFNE